MKFNTYIKIAARNVLRNKRRTLLTVITMAVGFMLYIFFDSLFSGIDKMLVESLIKYSDGSVVIYTKEYDENKKSFPLNKSIQTPLKVINLIKDSLPKVEITYRIQFLAEMVASGHSKYITVQAVVPELDTSVFELKASIAEGSYFLQKHDALIGKALANDLNLKLRDIFTIVTKTKDDTYNAIDFVVVGLLDTPLSNINESSVIITYEAAEDLLNLKGTATSIHIKVPIYKAENIAKYSKRVEEISHEISILLGDRYKVYPFSKLYKDFLILMQQKRISSAIITFMLLLIAAVGIANTILMSVYERIKEIGVLMSVGFKPKQVKKLFLLEGVIIGFIGSVIGLFLGVLANLWLTKSGYNLVALYGGTGVKGTNLGIPVWGIIYGVWDIKPFLICLFFGIIVAMVSSYYPAKLASKLKPTEALRFI